METSKKHFVIVGGSLGGLAIGIALKSLGHKITILERNSTPLLHDQGAGIIAGGPALDFLSRYNRCARRDIAVPSNSRQYLDKSGAIVHSTPASHAMSSWDLTYHLLRANYDSLSSPYCDVPPLDPDHGEATHLHNSTFASVSPSPSANQLLITYHLTTSPSSSHAITADILIGADGPSSTIRSLFLPSVERTYAGYLALRGTVPETSLSPSTLTLLSEKFTFFHGPGVQFLTYLIPGKNGSLAQGERLLNFVWYDNFLEGGKELEEIMTDKDGSRHRTTVLPGMVSGKAWERQKGVARETLPVPFVEVVCKTERPFVQKVTDVISPENSFLDDRVVLIGDALAGFRPHTVASTSQAAYDAMAYADFVEGKVGREEWVGRTMGYARAVQRKGVQMGGRSQFGELELGELVRDRDEMSRGLEEGEV